MTDQKSQPDEFKFHCVKHPGQKTYLLLEDVVKFLRDMAATEETDVRDRLEEAADNVLKLKEQ